jgi:hypothetical protein
MEQQRARGVEGTNLRGKSNVLYNSPTWPLLEALRHYLLLVELSKLSISFPERTSGLQSPNSLLVCQQST